MTAKGKGYFAVLDGLDGSGKSTQAGLLARALEARGISVVHVREPGSTPFGEALRALLLDGRIERGRTAEILSFFAARCELLRQVLLPALERGSVVVCERWVSSTYAYQGGEGGGGRELVRALESLVLPRKPDRLFLLDLTPEAALARFSRPLDGIEGRGRGVWDSVRAGFLEYASTCDTVRVLDATLPPPVVAERILTTVLEDLDA